MSQDEKLNPKQELFCKLYASDREFFGNGTDSYIEAYDIDITKKGAYMAAAASASRLLKNVKVLARIDQLLDNSVLNDQHVDKQLGFWITQKASPQASVAAIREYNKLKSRILDKSEVTHKFEDMDDEQLERAIKAREDRIS